MNQPVSNRRGMPPLSLARMGTTALLVIGLLLINKGGLAGNVVFFGILVGMIFRSPEWALRAFTIAFLGLVANQAIVQKTAFWTPARFVIPAACLVRFALDLASLRSGLLRDASMKALTVFVFVAAVLSILTQYFVPIALLKLVNFTITSFAILASAKVMQLRRSDMTEWYVSIILTTVVLGLATMALGIGNNFRGAETVASYFNGPFYHSNCLGPMAAMMVVYLVCVVVFGEYRNKWICLAMIGCLLYFMYLTKSRTSFGSLSVGIVMLLGLSYVYSRRGLIRLRMKVSRSSLVGGLAVVCLGFVVADIATLGTLSRQLASFANKGGQSEGFDLGQALSSRQDMYSFVWQNFLESPLIGIGFEVSKSHYFEENATLFYAPIEKGFLPLAVLEETGVIGTFFFLVFLVTYMRSLGNSLNVPGLAMFLTFLAVNCGESMFFALGGHGAFGWLLFTAGTQLGDRCVERIQPFKPSQSAGAAWLGPTRVAQTI